MRLWFCAALLAACGGSESEPPAAAVPEADPRACAAGELPLEGGGCLAAGIPPEMCGEGFEPDGAWGCVAVLPEKCPPGMMAVPGDTRCREVAPCAEGTWGAIPVDDTTQYVQSSYAGGDSDGSATKPWTKIGDAVAAAEPGAIIALARGSYAEDVHIALKPVRLWGVCPAEVELTGAVEIATVVIDVGANGTELRDLAVTGNVGVFLSGSEEVTLDRVHVRQTQSRGIDVEAAFGPTSVTVARSLVESAHEIGVFTSGVRAAMDAVVIRDTLPIADLTMGRGLNVQRPPGGASAVTVRRSVIEGNRDLGVFASGTTIDIGETVIRDTLVQESDQAAGRGLDLARDDGGRTAATIRASVIERNHGSGVFASGSDVDISATVIRDTLPDARLFGRGLGFEHSEVTLEPSIVTMRSSLVAGNNEIGVVVEASEALFESVLVRDTHPLPDGTLGRGLNIQDGGPGLRAHATLRGCVVERSYDVGVNLVGSDLKMEATAVRDTFIPAIGGLGGRGISVEINDVSGERSWAEIFTSTIERSHEFGVIVNGADARIEDVTVRDTRPLADGRFGDGVGVSFWDVAASLTMARSRVEASARAGISLFGSGAAVGESDLECNTIHLDGEASSGSAWQLDDRGGNACGCLGSNVACKVLTSNLEPPAAL